jgi:hypothetical protein
LTPSTDDDIIQKMKKKKTDSEKVSIEFDERHLETLTTALEVYSRLRSGQIKFAIDAAFWDKYLTYNDGEVIESFVRTLVFRKEEEIINNKNSYYGVGCLNMKDGTVAWEIKKVIEQYLHYKRNNGMRRICDVSGDGPLEISGISAPKVLDSIKGYWKPQKEFRIPQGKQESMKKAMDNKDYEKAWSIVYDSFKKKPLPTGKKTRIEEVAGTYYVIVEEPYQLT